MGLGWGRVWTVLTNGDDQPGLGLDGWTELDGTGLVLNLYCAGLILNLYLDHFFN